MRPLHGRRHRILAVINMGDGLGGAIYSADSTIGVMGMLIYALTKQDEEPATTVLVFSGLAVGPSGAVYVSADDANAIYRIPLAQ